MERLNNILPRMLPRRQHAAEHADTAEGYPAQQARAYDGDVQRQRGTPPSPARGSPMLREQRAHMGQPHPYGAAAQNPQPPARRQPMQQDQRETRPDSTMTPTSRPMYLRPPDNTSFQQRPLQKPSQPRPASPYYPGDNDYPRDNGQQLPQGDALEQWQADDDGTASIREGDWEQGRDEDFIYQREAEVQSRPRAQHSSFSTRERPRVPASSVQKPSTRNPRAMPPPIPAPAPLPTPQPSARAYEAQRQARRTQPLDPQTIAEMQLEERALDGQLHSRPPIAMREQVLQYVPVEVPPPHPQLDVCPLCKGAGYLRLNVPVGHPQFGKPVACECKEEERREKRRQQLLELSDLSAFRNRSFHNFNTRFPGVHPTVQQAFQEAYTFAQNPTGWFVLIGPNGCGKTHLAAAIANQSLSDGAVVLFTVVPDLLANLRATFAPTSNEAYEERFAKMREAELLVLDDLGAQHSSSWANEKLFQLLNYRYNSCYPTVITANKQGFDSIDERIRSRICDTALSITIFMTGAIDYRRQNPRKELR